MRFRSRGRKPYVVPGGGSNPVGALGYVNAALELVHQAGEMGLRIDHMVRATGSAGTQAGLVTGLVALRAQVPVLGIGVRAPKPQQEDSVFALAERTAARLGVPSIIQRAHVVANCDYVGDGYGLPTEGIANARLPPPPVRRAPRPSPHLVRRVRRGRSRHESRGPPTQRARRRTLPLDRAAHRPSRRHRPDRYRLGDRRG